jgi:hypothetical protein
MALMAAGLAGLAGCQLAEPYLVPKRGLELVTNLQPDARSYARVPAVREADRQPVLIDYRALQLTDEDLAKAAARPARFYRVRAAQRHPAFIVGAVILGMALPHFALGLAVGLDKPPVQDDRAITDKAGGAIMMTLTGLHIAAGVTLMVLGERNPRIEPAESQLLYQYISPPSPDVPTDSASPDASQ